MGKRVLFMVGSVLLFQASMHAQAPDTWTQKANLSGAEREGAVAFSIGQFGYLGTGINTVGFLDDFWQYDPATDTWTQKANVPGGLRCHAVAFTIGNFGYIGTGAVNAGHSIFK